MEPGIPVLSLINAVLRRRRIVAWTTVVCTLALVVPALVKSRTYSSTVSFVPQAKQSSMAAGLAAQIGLAGFSGSDQSESPAFYGDLLESREILEDAVNTVYTYTDDGKAKTGTYTVIHEIEGPTAARRQESAIRLLKSNIQVVVNQRTGVISATVSDEDVGVAKQIAARLLELVSRFNLEVRQSRARSERKFTEAQLNIAQAALRSADDQMLAFLLQNRDYHNSPSLVTQQARLDRELTFRKDAVDNLAQSYENAKIEEVRNTPVVSVIEQPELAAMPDSRGVIKRGILGIVLGMFLSIFVIVIIDFFQNQREERPTLFGEFVTLRHATATDIRRPWRLFGRRKGGDEVA